MPSQYPCSLCHAVLRYDPYEVLIGVIDDPIQSSAQTMEITNEQENYFAESYCGITYVPEWSNKSRSEMGQFHADRKKDLSFIKMGV
jgi:hypothetical protein